MKNQISNIKNIIFDLGGVILKNKPITYLNNFNISNDIYNELKKFFYDWKDLNLGKESLEGKFYKCNFSKEIENKYKQLLLNYYEYREINKELIDLIKKLKDNNYKVYILSDNNIESCNYYKNHVLFKNIDGWVFSCEYHVCKRDGILFKLFLNKYNLDANECYFIDDLENNIGEAKKYGIKGYKYDKENNINQLCYDMRNNGINI